MWTCQNESESSLPTATDKAEEGSKNGLRSDLRASNLKNFPPPQRTSLAAVCLRMQSRTQPDQSILLLPGLNLIHTANSRAVEVNSFNSDKLPGRFFNERPGYEATCDYNLGQVDAYSRI